MTTVTRQADHEGALPAAHTSAAIAMNTQQQSILPQNTGTRRTPSKLLPQSAHHSGKKSHWCVGCVPTYNI